MSEAINPALVPRFQLSTGEEIPCIGMGTFGNDRYSHDQVAEAVSGALQCGYRLFDCAAAYGNEKQIGKALEEALRNGIVRRDELFIMSKVWNDMHGKGDVLLACAASLRDLRLDYLDAYFVHWPFPNYHAPGCAGDSRNPDSKPFSAERFLGTWRQMERLYDMGLARHLGMSNMTIPKLEAVLPHCRVRPALIEMELHPSFQQQAMFDYVVEQGIMPVGFSPIGSPCRPERDTMSGDVVDIEIPAVVDIARAHGLHPAEICLKWAVQRGQIPIPFTVHPHEYTANLRCTTRDPLSDEEMTRLRQADTNRRLIRGQVFLWPEARDWRELWDE